MNHEHTHDHPHPSTDWKHDGVRVVPGNQLDVNVPSTPGRSILHVSARKSCGPAP